MSDVAYRIATELMNWKEHPQSKGLFIEHSHKSNTWSIKFDPENNHDHATIMMDAFVQLLHSIQESGCGWLLRIHPCHDKCLIFVHNNKGFLEYETSGKTWMKGVSKAVIMFFKRYKNNGEKR